MSAADQAAALTDEGNMHLAAGWMRQAQACFRKALTLQDLHQESSNGSTGPALADDEDDWEQSDLGLKLEALAVSMPAQGPQSTSKGTIDSISKSKAAPEVVAASPARRPPEASYRSPTRSSQLPSPVAVREEDSLAYDGRHILEIYGFSSTTSLSTLDRYVQELNSHAIDASLRFADDNTALAMFANPAAASEALQRAEGGKFKVRPFSEAQEASKHLPFSELQPPKPRPATSAAAARRLIGAALGTPGLIDKAAERSLRQQRKESKDLKAERQRMADAAWDD